MTTIAYDHKNKKIAYDSRIATPDGVICSDDAVKVTHENGNHWFICGSVRDHQLLIDSFAGLVMINYEIDAYGFRVDKNGNVDICQLDERGNPTICPVDYSYALGSGFEFALAAMDFGKTAVEAVEYTKTRDSNTGGKVYEFDVKNLRVTNAD